MADKTIYMSQKKGKFSIDNKLIEIFQVTRDTWVKEAPRTIIKNIKDTIAIGNSPVSGYGRFVKYSKSYSDAILKGRYKKIAPNKGVRPVNLYLTGKLMNSLIYRETKSGFTIYFTNKLAKIHSEQGASIKKVIRKITPSEGESFKKSVTIEADNLVNDLLMKEFKNLF